MSETDQRPRCSRCGLPARVIRALARVSVQLELDGTPGRIVYARCVDDPDQALDLVSDEAAREYQCGIGHRWRVQPPETPSTDTSKKEP
jgi:hypothetical protein